MLIIIGSMKTNYLPVSWNVYVSYAQKLAATILQHSPEVNQIVSISRGGLTLGHVFADLLQIPIATLAIQSYANLTKQGELKITEPLSIEIKGKHVLLVDDVSDTGKTLVRAETYLRQFHPKSITTVTMFFKPTSEKKPDYFAKKTSSWIIFPYETTETILSLTKLMEKEGLSKSRIQQFLKPLGFTETQIKFVRKYHYGTSKDT